MTLCSKILTPNLVAQQLDIGNMYGGGGRAAELLKQYPGRFELMHVKDESRVKPNTAVGKVQFSAQALSA